jgi:hypothetical protein
MTFDNCAWWCRMWETINAMDHSVSTGTPWTPPPPFPDDLPPTRIVRNDDDRHAAFGDIMRRLDPHWGKRWWDVERWWTDFWRGKRQQIPNKKLPLPPLPPLPEGVPPKIFGFARDVVAAFRRAPVPGGE